MSISHLPQSPSDLRRFRSSLLRWFDRNQRPLPWRDSRDPYRVWVSEIMLQQTRVAAVLAHYRRFLERFPDVRSLAAARLSAVLAAWSGLGYYRRARALHAAARAIVNQHGGRFPQTALEWQDLPGIGRYTAAAVASIAFNQPVAVLDGNVDRILRRLAGDGSMPQSDAWSLAQRLLSPARPGDCNQAMMELGALVCLPGQPDCAACPVTLWCATRGPLARAAKELRQVKQIAYLLAQQDNRVYLVQRSAAESLMPGMWELPEIEPNGATADFTLRHSITITDYRVSVFRRNSPMNRAGRWVTTGRLHSVALTGLARKILQRSGVL